jgi:alanyl-tRNA synthetase
VSHKLFYQDAYIQTFSAKVASQQQDGEGKWFVVLNQTAFYPTGGGQPHDTGSINDIKVVNVVEIDEEIRHFLERQLLDGTEEVIGKINWKRRFDHMQQHAGQHILSAAFVELFGYETVSFHLGKEVSTIDLSIENLTEQQVEKVEELVNQLILENRSIESRWVTAEEAAKLPLRKQLSVSENIRLVIIPDFDYNGCGGTHPNSTGQVGSLKILGWERQKKQVRVQFVCGNRVIAQLDQKRKILVDLSPLLNAPEQELVSAVTRLMEAAKEKDKSLVEAREMLLHYEAMELLNSCNEMNGTLVISKVLQNRTIQELQKLARMITTKSVEAVVFLIAENEDRIQLVCAKGESARGSMKQILGELMPLISGKGGGNEISAQGGGIATITGEQLLQLGIEKLLVK